jgi:DNA-binding CsgD family transcriptional regulator
MVLGCVRAWLGDSAGGIAQLREAYRLSTELRAPEDSGGIANNLADALLGAGRVEEALEVCLEGREAMRRVGLRAYHGAFLEIGAADCLLRLGRWDEAARWTAPLLAQLPADPDSEIYLRAVCAMLDTRRGELDAATTHVARGVELLDANVSRDPILMASVARAEHAVTSGSPVTTRDAVDEARTRLAPLPGGLLLFPPLLSLGLRAEADIAERARATGDPDGVLAAHQIAAGLLEALLSCQFLEPTDAPAPPEVLAHHTAGRAEFARLEGTPQPELWEHAADQWTALGMPFEAAYAQWRAAEGSLAGGLDRASAQRRLSEAHGLAAGLGAVVLQREIDALARRARIAVGSEPADRKAAEAPGGLTARELTVLQLMSAGRTNREIADELFLSRRTVDMHVRHILAKLNAANRVEAAGIAHRLGLGTPA